MRAPRLDRRENLTEAEFRSGYLKANRPVIVTRAMERWSAVDRWTPEFFVAAFGSTPVQIYDDAFDLQRVAPLREYIDAYFAPNVPPEKGPVPYVRWYSRLRDADFAWADAAFEQLSDDWASPSFFPRDDFLIPFAPPGTTVDPVRDLFPARALFLSARGARTRLHRDPWATDAVLCQVRGTKDVIMYAPEQAPLLTRGRKVVDVDAPDHRLFPGFAKAQISFEDSLRQGEVLFIPAGWIHQLRTIEDSVSVTWNFAHVTTWPAVFRYLSEGAPTDEVARIRYFLERR